MTDNDFPAKSGTRLQFVSYAENYHHCEVGPLRFEIIIILWVGSRCS